MPNPNSSEGREKSRDSLSLKKRKIDAISLLLDFAVARRVYEDNILNAEAKDEQDIKEMLAEGLDPEQVKFLEEFYASVRVINQEAHGNKMQDLCALAQDLGLEAASS